MRRTGKHIYIELQRSLAGATQQIAPPQPILRVPVTIPDPELLGISEKRIGRLFLMARLGGAPGNSNTIGAPPKLTPIHKQELATLLVGQKVLKSVAAGVSFQELQYTCFRCRKSSQPAPCLNGQLDYRDHGPEIICTPCHYPLHCAWCPNCPRLQKRTADYII